MKHYTDENWLDYARGFLTAESRQQMQAHLEAGCDHCRQLAAFWGEANQASAHLSLEEPPESAVRLAKAAFSQAPPANPPSLWIQVAQLLFDSYVAAPAGGIRSISPTARHLLYQFEAWTIDLRLDGDTGNGLTISGQVLEAAAEPSTELTAEIILLRGETELKNTSTNEFGEFQLFAEQAANLSIRVTIAQQKPITIKFPE